MAQVKGLTTAQVIAAARAGREGVSKSYNIQTYAVDDFRARYGYSGAPVGRMPESWARIFRERYGLGKVSQVLISFQTAIAWKDADYGWVMPNVTYSIITTTKHQGPARGGWNNPGLGDIVSPAMPWDATLDDARRVLSGELIFTRAGKWGNGKWNGTRPGPNYIPEGA
ncbi:hypothetical protein SEA_HUBBS_118 [Microbacterium phage Hubbs]|nr:hypothetical protein SEA_HUBBS_4 [Microbacterium phage Hubbs]QIG58663.1 hypothetical protein SEA_HUBBS_118 [Microbacterium phage Hubbs]